MILLDPTHIKTLWQQLLEVYESFPHKNFDEVDILPAEDTKTDSNPIIVAEEKGVFKLGIELWALKSLLPQAKNNLENGRQLGLSTFVFLILVPDDLRLHNIRKRLVLERRTEAEAEWKVMKLLLSKHVKSTPLFMQIRWLLRNYASSFKTKVFLDEMFSLLTKLSERRFSNYNAFDHRRWMVEFIRREVKEEFGGCLERELMESRGMCEANMRNCSIWSYREFLLTFCDGVRLEEERKWMKEILEREGCEGLVIEHFRKSISM